MSVSGEPGGEEGGGEGEGKVPDPVNADAVMGPEGEGDGEGEDARRSSR